nr:hypothetical protein [Tanacetum cinerariifolium]
MHIIMENPNHLNEPNQVADIHDTNEMVDIPDDIELVDYDEEDPEEDPKEEPEEDVDIELDDDVELIFPYKVEEDEEVDVAPKASTGTITQKPYAIRDFSRGLLEVGESSSAHDSSNVDGFASWALRSNQAPAAPDVFAPQWIGEHDPNNNNGWIEWDVPLGGEVDEPMVDVKPT